MYIAKEEFIFRGKIYKVGERVNNPTQKLIDQGVLLKVIDPRDSKEILLVDDSSNVEILLD